MNALDRQQVGTAPATSTRSLIDMSPSKTRDGHPFSVSFSPLSDAPFRVGSSSKKIKAAKNRSPREERTDRRTSAAARSAGVRAPKNTRRKTSEVAQHGLEVEMTTIGSGRKRGAPLRVQNPSSTTQSSVEERHDQIISSSNRPVSPRLDEPGSSNTASSSSNRPVSPRVDETSSSIDRSTLKRPRIEASGQGLGTRVVGVFSLLGAGWLAAETAFPGITNTVVSSIVPGTQNDYTAQLGLSDRIDQW